MEWFEFTSEDPGIDAGDLRPFLERVRHARVIGLGESTAGSRETIRLKHRLIELLAREASLSAVVLEANLADVIRVNEYALEGRGDPPELLRRYLHRDLRTREMADLVRWMWDFNTSGQGRVALAGCDMQRIDTAAEIVTEFLAGVDPGLAESVGRRYEIVLEANRAQWLAGAGIQAWFPVEAARGRRIRMSAHVRTDAVSDHACLWCWAGGADGTLAYDALEGRRPRGTTPWREYAIEVDVPETAKHVSFGCFLAGEGRAWFDGLSVTVDGEPWQDPQAIDLDFSSEELRGFWVDPRVHAALDADGGRTSVPSLRIEPAVPVAETSYMESYTLAKEVLSELTARFTAREAGRALRCALSVVQGLEMRAGGGDTARARSMAENVEWLIARQPGTRVVFWAGNGQIARGGIDTGAFLARNLGSRYLPVAFATGEGTHTSVQPRHSPLPKEIAPPPEGSIEARLLAIGSSRMIVDLRTVDEEDPEWGWLTKRHPFRLSGGASLPDQFADQRVPANYDLLIWQRKTMAATPLSG